MRKMLFGVLPRVLVLLTVVAFSFAIAKEDPANRPKSDNSLAKTAGTPIAMPLNINNFVTWMKVTGQGNWTSTNKDGGYYPRGTSWAIYQDGFVFGGKPYLDAAKTQAAPIQDMRVGGQSYNVGTRGGQVNGFGAGAVAVSPANADVRMYRVRRDYLQMGTDELRRDAAEVNEKLSADVTDAEMAAVKSQYARDWDEWPVALGAPYVERNGIAGYQKPPAFNYDVAAGALFTTDSLISQKRDEPGIAGADPNSPADQVMWNVFNDLDPVGSTSFVGSEPLGLEFQCTIWGYKRADALGNLYFKKYRIINKGGVDIDAGRTQKGVFYIDSLYFCQWSDPDLGGSGDDLTGCDSTMSIGFIYNGNAIDAEFKKFSIPPPAAAYDFLQGPVVASPGDSAVFDLKIRQGYKNLPMTSYAYFSAGSPISDPPFTYEGAKRWYRLLKGYVPDASTATLRLFPHPPGVTETLFPLSGDPVTGRGFVDGAGTDYSYSPGDRRLLLNSGPITMAPGDTQEVVVGVVGGLGSDRLSSVAVMKFNDEFVQNTYNALFAVPKAPPQPDVKIAQLNEKIVLEWSSNEQRVKDIENVISQPGSYAFEGYNVYQLPSLSSPLPTRNTLKKDGVRIATFDLPTDPAIILDRQFDTQTGLILQIPIQYGANSGIARKFVFDRDYIKDVKKLYNGSEYFLAVTAYKYSQIGFSPAALESPAIVYRVVPQGPPPGTRYASAYGDTVHGVVQTFAAGASASEGMVIPIVIDPSKVNGHAYKVTFKTDATGATIWDLTDVTAGKVVLANQPNQSGDENYTVVDGLLVKVTGPATPGMKDWSIPSGTRRWTPLNGEWGSEGFIGNVSGAIGNAYDQWFSGSTVTYGMLKNVRLKLAATDADGNVTDPNDADFSFGYRYMRGATAAAAKPEFAPFMINKTAGYAFQEYIKNMPLAAYNDETTPPTRLMVGFLENNSAGGLVDGKYWPGVYTAVDNIASSGPREWMFIFSVPYSTTPDPTLQVDILNTTLPIMWFCTFNRRAGTSGAPYLANDEFLILANHINTTNNTFTFNAPAVTKDDAALAKQDVGKVGVFPNPYYAFNPQETNRQAKFVTFNKMPTKATVRIFNLAGQLVRVLEKDDATQFLRWDLRNRDNFPVASGMYIVHVDMPTIGATKVLKLAVIQEQEVPDVF
jgi:hypothetical protein